MAVGPYGADRRVQPDLASVRARDRSKQIVIYVMVCVSVVRTIQFDWSLVTQPLTPFRTYAIIGFVLALVGFTEWVQTRLLVKVLIFLLANV